CPSAAPFARCWSVRPRSRSRSILLPRLLGIRPAPVSLASGFLDEISAKLGLHPRALHLDPGRLRLRQRLLGLRADAPRPALLSDPLHRQHLDPPRLAVFSPLYRLSRGNCRRSLCPPRFPSLLFRRLLRAEVRRARLHSVGRLSTAPQHPRAALPPGRLAPPQDRVLGTRPAQTVRRPARWPGAAAAALLRP